MLPNANSINPTLLICMKHKHVNPLLENYVKRKREMSFYFLIPLGFNSI